MATAAPQSHDNDLKNWIKGAFALHVTKEGLEDFVTDEISQFQTDLLTSICRNIGKPVGTICNSCTTANILPCPTNGFCTSGGRCKMHVLTDRRREPNIPCKSNICQAIRGGIRREHRYFHPSKFEPSWKNADATQFCSDSFQLAKCYMSVDGYSKVQSLAETDFNGVINVVINNKRFQNKLSAKLSQKTNICTEARDIGRLIRHSPNLAVSDADLTKYIDTLIDLLSDRKYLATENKAKIAVAKLQKLKTTYLLDDKDSETIIAAILTSVKSMKDNTKEDIIQQAMKEIKDMIQVSKKEVHDATQVSSKKITSTSNLELEKIKVVAEEAIQKFHETEARKMNTKDKKCSTEEVDRENFRSEVTYGLEQVIHLRVEEASSKTCKHVDLDVRRLREGLREDLILSYRECYSTFPVKNIIGELNIPLLKLYVHQKLEAVGGIKSLNQSEESESATPVKTYKELFFCGTETYKNIYITANAGTGKTLLMRIFCLSWCQAYKPVEVVPSEFQKENLDAIQYFEFVFFLSLDDTDDTNSSACDIDDLIEIQILRKLSRQHQYTKRFLVDILNRKACLIILDGLNKWSHPDNCTSGCRMTRFPRRAARPNCTTMTTTLPWNFVFIQRTKQIDRHINICELDKDTAAKLIGNVASFLNEKSAYKKSANSKEIQKAITKSMFDEPCLDPYSILQFACLLFARKSIGRSKCEIYSNQLELSLSRGLKNVGHVPSYAQTLKRKLPRFFVSNIECKTNYGILLCIGRFAFETLFGGDSVSRLRFTETDVMRYMSSNILDVSLKLGILTQDRTCESFSAEHLSLKFENFTMQAYFAALYIQSEQSEVVKFRIHNECKSLQTVLRVFPVFVFISGFDQALASDLLPKLFSIASEDDKILEVRRTSSLLRSSIINSELVKRFQSLVINCVDECIKNDHDGIKLSVKDIIIDTSSQQDNSLTSLIECNVNNLNNLKSLSIQECNSTDTVNKILQQLNTQNIRHLRKLELRCIPNTLLLRTLLRNSRLSLRCLELSSLAFENATKKYHFEVINIPSDHIKIISSMPFLGVLTLGSLRISHDDFTDLLSFLSRKTEMKHIILYHLVCSKYACGGHMLDLSLHKKLEALGLDSVPLSKLRLNAVNQFLEECWIGKLPSHILSAAFPCLENAHSLHTLYCLKLDDLCAMLQSIPKLRRLKYICFRYINFGNRVISLTSNTKNIQIVSLNGVTLTSDALKRLIDTIKTLPHEVDICLKNCKVTPVEEYKHIKSLIRGSDDFIIMSDGLNEQKVQLFQFGTVNKSREIVQSGNVHAITSTRMQAITSPSEQIV
ncbi:uncharacterized protein LOC128548548 [Mercenaria mercenaria]|uniref:uncharacterized protein LOC128548548 n=1 Tax=Mercenaria mercenaria TaxID=6596 RepID=UPI00234E5B9E|nr:uncharacterized protein LOC128548548 [Mercenaria mercenaria]XP_053379687.1 uncharacterized protein LOC128548548 [Mercenaria mercenaria]